jgi:hypothetical protein
MTAKLLVQLSWREPATRWLPCYTTLRAQIEQDARRRVLEATAGEMPVVEVTIEERQEESGA